VPVSAGTAALQVVPTLTKSFSRDLVTQMTGPAVKGSAKAGKEHGRRFGTSFSGGLRAGVGPVRGILRGFGPQLAAAFGGAALVGAIKSVTDEAREAAVVGKQTAAVLKSTGGVAKVTAKQVGDLAESISNATGVDDEMIQTGQNWLLTFKNVRNEAGKGNAVFDRASKAAVDMAAAMHQGEVSASGLHTANTQLGKALNDPIKGMTALAKAGVTFDAQQQKQIKTLVKHGDLLGAQKIILAEVESQTKGFAAASADTWTRLGTIWNNAKETIGKALLPVLDKVGKWLAVKIPQGIAVLQEALRAVKDWWVKNKDAIMATATALAEFYSPSVKDATGKTKTMSSTAEQFLGILKGLIAGLLQGVKVWLWFEKGIIGVYHAVANLIIGGGRAIHVIDRLSGGTGHAGDAMVQFGRDLKNQANRELKAVKEQAIVTQRAIDKMHGKTITVNVKGMWDPPKGFTTKTLIQMSTPGGRGGFAAGGRINVGTGPTADDVPIWVSKGEAVVPTRSASKPEFQQWAASERIPGYAKGGVVGQGLRAMQGLSNHTATAMTRVMARALERATKLAFGGGSPAIKAFIRSVDPLPYIWGAAGPGGYDCSGLVSAVLGKMTGRGGGHGQRYFTTSSIRSGILGIKPGLGGTLQIGVTAGTGHMAGRYGGLGFEAESSRTGIKTGAGASRPESFARHFHLAKGGKIDPALVALFARSGADIGGDTDKLRINGQTFDRGGTLSPGLNLLVNRTGRPEPLVPANGEPTRIEVHIHGAVIGSDLRKATHDLADGMRSAIRDAQRRAGVPAREQVR
jgi:hypothetical protein